MSKDPAFLFYSSDFITGVSDLSMEERGIYITLLCLEHQKGRLSKKLISICCGNAEADAVASVLHKFSIDENGLYYNKRLELEIEKRKVHSDKQREKAKQRWDKAKKGAEINNAVAYSAAYAQHMPLENENVNEIENIIDNKKEYEKFDFKKSLLQKVNNPKLIDEWLKVRKTKKLTNSETALKYFLNQVEKSKWDIEKVIEKCIIRSWGGFEAEWVEKELIQKSEILNPIQENENRICEYSHPQRGNFTGTYRHFLHLNSNSNSYDFIRFIDDAK